MSRERKQKLAQSRRRNALEEEDGDNNESGPAIIDDSASDANSDDDLQISGSDNDDEDEEEDEGEKVGETLNNTSKRSVSTSESYDRLEDDTLQGNDFVNLSASNGSVGAAKVTDTAVILNGFKDVAPDEDDAASDPPMQFDELDDSISFEPRLPQAKASSTSSGRGAAASATRGGARDRPDRETFWQRRNREKEEYKKQLEDPTFTPYVGEFFMHDSRRKRQFDSLNQVGGPRGRGRGGRGFRGRVHRELPGREVPAEPAWGHDGFEELEPEQSIKLKTTRGTAQSQTSSQGRQTPQRTAPHNASETSSQAVPQEKESPKQDLQSSRLSKNHRPNISTLNSKLVTINISLPNTKTTVKDVTLSSYVGRVPYQKPLRGDRPVKISSIEGAGNREVYPSKERSWLPYFLKNVANASQAREGIHSRRGSIASSGTPNNVRPVVAGNGTLNRVPSSAHAQPFNPQSPAPGGGDDDDKPTKIKVNLPPVTTTASASPAVSDASSLHVHHPRPTKHINIADIDDSSARLKAFLNPQTSSSPAHSHDRTPSTAIPETAVHAAPFQPSFVPSQTQGEQIPTPFASAVPYYYPPSFAALPTDYPQPSTQNPYLLQQPRYESNGMVYYYDPSFYYFPPPVDQTGTPVQSTSQTQQSSEQPDPANTSNQQMYYYQMGVTDPQRAAAMGMYYPYQQGT